MDGNSDSIDYGSLIDEQQGQGPTGPGRPDVPARPAPADNEYLSLIDGGRENTRTMIQGAAFVASKRKDPARWARVLELADRAKLPADVVDRNFDTVNAADERSRNDYDHLITDTPGLAAWLKNPDNATIAKDEIRPLARVERGTRIITENPLVTVGRGFARSGRSVETGFKDLEAAAGHLAVGAGLASPEAGAEFVAAANRRAQELRATAPDYVKEFGQSMEQHGGNVERAFLTFRSIQDELHRGEILKALADYGNGTVKTVGELLDMIGAAASRPRGLFMSTVEGLTSMIPALAGAGAGATAGAELAGPIGAAVGMAGGTFFGMAPVNVGSEINAELQRRGVDVTDAQSLLRAYRNPQLMAEVRAHAERSGLTSAGIAAFVASFAGKLTVASQGGSALMRGAATAADVGVQAGGMAAADVGGQVAGAKGDLSKVDVGRAAQLGISMLGYGVGETAIGASHRALFAHDPVVAATDASNQAADAMRAQRDAQALQEIGDALKEAPNTTSLPDRVKQLVETANSGSEASTIYFQTKDWDEFFQAQGASPSKAASDIMGDEGRGYFDAKTTGAPIAIPLEDYVSKVGNTDYWTGLLRSARTRPDGMSLLEANEYLEALPATMADLAKEATQGQSETSVDAAAKAIGEDIAQQLIKTGRYDERTSRTFAKTLYERFYRNVAQRAGLDPAELYRRRPVTVSAPERNGPAPTGSRADLQEVANRAIAQRETQAERAAIQSEEGANPYATPVDKRDASTKTGEQFTFARDSSGRLRPRLEQVHTDGLIDELARLLETNGQDANLTGPTIVEEEGSGVGAVSVWTGRKFGAAKALGRIASRQKSITKIEAELGRRGITDVDERLWRAFTGADMPSFEFNQSAVVRRFVALGNAAADAENSPEVRAEAARRAAEIENQARADYRADFDRANADFTQRTGVDAGDVFFQSNRRQTLSQDEPAPRGQIRIGPRHIDIALLEDANLSTFIHETGHFYAEMLRDLSSQAGAATDIKRDWDILRDWTGAKDGETLTREQHEQIARGFEAYLMEGKAPSIELRGAFARFRAWLVGLYRSFDALQVLLSPEVRGVFDRLLASEEEIAAAQREQGMDGLSEALRAAGVPEKALQPIVEAESNARHAAEEYLTSRLIADVQREQSSVFLAERARVRQEVGEEVNQDRDYLALTLMARGRLPDGSPLPAGLEPFKLSKADLVEHYADRYPSLMVRLRSRFLYSKEGGVHPDMAAEILGYSSGDEMLRALLALPGDAKRRIDELTDERIRDEHPELLSPTELPVEAMKAIHNEKRAELHRKVLELLASDDLATLKGLVRRVARPVAPIAEVRAEAERVIGGQKVREINPLLYQRTEQKAAKAAVDALMKGDIQTAFEEKVKERLAQELFTAATDAKEAIEKSVDGFKKVFGRDERLAESRDLDLVNTARAILASFGIGTTDKPPLAYLEQMRRYDPEMYDAVIEMVNDATGAAGDYTKLSYEQFKSLDETVSSLWSLSRRNRQIEIEGRKLDRADVERELGQRLDELGSPSPKAGYTKAVTNWEKTSRHLMSVRAFLRRAEMWVDAMDAGNPDGAFRKYILNPVFDGTTKFRLQKRSSLAKYLDVVKPVEKGIKTGTIDAPELGYTFRGRAELLGALLHTGNESNFQKLLRGRHWGDYNQFGNLDRARWDAFVDRMHREGVLTKPDYDYVQGVWDLFEELKPDAQRAHKEIYGHYFSEITAQPFDTPFGTYKGGYYPALTDSFMVADRALRQEQESFLQGQNGFMFPTTGRGFTKQRTEGYAKALTLDAATVPLAIDAVLRFTHIEPHVRDVARVVMSREFRPQLDDFDPTIGREMLVPWLQRAAQQRTQMPGLNRGVDAFWRWMRNSTGLQILTANVIVALEQITHMPGAAVKVPVAKLGSALWRYIRAPKQVAESIHEKSEYMRTRETAAVMEIQKSIDNLLLDPSKYQKLRDFTREHGYFLSRAVQNVSDIMTWSGAYDHAIEQGAAELDAVRRADSAVRETQGSYEPESLSRFETSTPFVRAFSLFYSFFNAKANLLGTEFVSSMRASGLRKGAGRLLYVYALGFMVPAVFAGAIKQIASGRDFDEDDDGPVDDVFRLFFESQLEMAERMVPGGSVVASTVGAFTKKPSDDDIMVSPAVKTIEAAVHAPGDVYRAVHDKMVTSKAIKDVLTLLGLITGLPLAPLAKPLGHAHDVSIGKARPYNRADYVRGLLTGHAGGH